MLKSPSVLLVVRWACILVLVTHAVPGQRIRSTKSPFGKGPPSIPILFEPGVISIAAATTYRPAFTPDGRIVYYTMEVGADYVILVSRFQHGRWTQPEIASFSGKYSDALAHLLCKHCQLRHKMM
jgi:hypothetical protein